MRGIRFCLFYCVPASAARRALQLREMFCTTVPGVPGAIPQPFRRPYHSVHHSGPLRIASGASPGRSPSYSSRHCPLGTLSERHRPLDRPPCHLPTRRRVSQRRPNRPRVNHHPVYGSVRSRVSAALPTAGDSCSDHTPACVRAARDRRRPDSPAVAGALPLPRPAGPRVLNPGPGLRDRYTGRRAAAPECLTAGGRGPSHRVPTPVLRAPKYSQCVDKRWCVCGPRLRAGGEG